MLKYEFEAQNLKQEHKQFIDSFLRRLDSYVKHFPNDDFLTQMYNAFNYTYPEQMHQYGKVRPLTDYAREITMSELASEENEDTKMCNDTTNGRKK